MAHCLTNGATAVSSDPHGRSRDAKKPDSRQARQGVGAAALAAATSSCPMVIGS
jgi:hypothetical protein